MKKVLFIHHWSSVGGSGISLYNTWNSLKNHYDITTYIPDSPSDLSEFLVEKGLYPKTYAFTCGQIPYYSGGSAINRLGFWYLIFLTFTQFNYWRKIVKLENPDIIMVNSKVLCWMAPLFRRRKSVCFVRETIKGSSNSVINRLMKHYLEQFSLVSFLSQYDLDQTNLKRAYSIVSPDILNIDEYKGKITKEEACESFGIESDSFNLAFVGGFDPLKGIEQVIKALSLLKESKVRLLVAGDLYNHAKTGEKMSISRKILMLKKDRYKNHILKLIKDRQVDNMISFVGIQKDVSYLYSACDALIFPMVHPHQARPAFEIGVQKKPVLIADFENIKEFVIDGVSGLCFDSKKPDVIAEKIALLVENPKLCLDLGIKNHEYTMKYHTADFAIMKLIEGLNKI